MQLLSVSWPTEQEKLYSTVCKSLIPLWFWVYKIFQFKFNQYSFYVIKIEIFMGSFNTVENIFCESFTVSWISFC